MLNKAILMGRLTADPELRHTPGGKGVASFTVAVNRNYGKDRERQTDFIDIVAWGTTAEFGAKWFRKGMLAAVCGRIQVRRWEDREGACRKSVEVVADEVFFAEGKRKEDAAEESAPENAGFVDAEDDGELPF